MLRFACLVLSLAALGLGGCSSESTGGSSDDDDKSSKKARGGDDDDVDDDDPANQPPHALGTITLGESHLSEGGSVFPFVTASFVPDAAAVQSCKKKLEGGCEIALAAKCGDEGCDPGEVCAFDKSCKPTCQKVAVCSMECEEEEVCTLGKSGKAMCTKIETFDAGPLAFSGTTTAITLYPPYKFEASGKGAPFLAGAELEIQAQGATDAGFERFEETFTATTFLQSKPKLNKVSRADAFGKGSLPISWVPGDDAIVVTVAGPGGSASCKAKDATGKFEIPRSVVDAAIGEDAYGSPTLTLSLSRQRKETKKGLKTTGELASVDVQPEAWVDLVTMSTETATLQGCQAGQTACDEGCFDLDTDVENCGTCGKTCITGQTCNSGKCTGDACSVCRENAKTGACKSQWDACKVDPSCASTAACIAKCTTQECMTKCQFLGSSTDKIIAVLNCASTACDSKCP